MWQCLVMPVAIHGAENTGLHVAAMYFTYKRDKEKARLFREQEEEAQAAQKKQKSNFKIPTK